MNFLGTLGENQLTINIRVYFRIFNSIPILDVYPYAYHFDYYKVKVKVKSLSCVQPSATPWTAAHQPPPSMGFSRQEYIPVFNSGESGEARQSE